MSYIQSSPWTDAAEFGRALGDRLSEALIQLPAIRAKIAMTQAAQRQDQANKNREFGLEEERIQAIAGQRQQSNEFNLKRLDEKTANDQANVKVRQDANTQRMRATGQAQDTKRAQTEQNNAFNQKKLDETTRHNKAMEARQPKPNKQQMQMDIVKNAQALFQKTKNRGMAMKYINDQAKANGLNLNPYSVSLDADPVTPAPVQ